MSSRFARVGRICGQICSGYQFRSIEPRRDKTLGFVATSDGLRNLYRDFVPVLPTVLHGFKKKGVPYPRIAVTVEGILFMGCKKFVKQTNVQLQRHIRTQAANSANVVILVHASDQMKARKVSRMEVIECLRNGMISRPPVPDEQGGLRCRMEHYTAGRNCMAIVSLCDEAADLIVVTVMTA